MQGSLIDPNDSLFQEHVERTKTFLLICNNKSVKISIFCEISINKVQITHFSKEN